MNLHDDAHGLHKSDPRRESKLCFSSALGNIPDGFHLTRANPSQEVVQLLGRRWGRNGLARWHKVVGAAEIGL